MKWNANGHHLVTGSKDASLKVTDARTLKTISSHVGSYSKDIASVTWHPHDERVFTSGAADGSIAYWIVGAGSEPHAEVRGAHENQTNSLVWHPAGHLLVSGSNDNAIKFWCRNRPGEVARDTTKRMTKEQYAQEAIVAAHASAVLAVREREMGVSEGRSRGGVLARAGAMGGAGKVGGTGGAATAAPGLAVVQQKQSTPPPPKPPTCPPPGAPKK